MGRPACSTIPHPLSPSALLKGPPPVPVPIGAPVFPGLRWVVRCHGSDEAGRVAPPDYYVRRRRRLPRLSNTAGDSHYDRTRTENQVRPAKKTTDSWRGGLPKASSPALTVFSDGGPRLALSPRRPKPHFPRVRRLGRAPRDGILRRGPPSIRPRSNLPRGR